MKNRFVDFDKTEARCLYSVTGFRHCRAAALNIMCDRINFDMRRDGLKHIQHLLHFAVLYRKALHLAVGIRDDDIIILRIRNGAGCL